MAKRYLVGGPSNSGKSSLLLSSVEFFRTGYLRDTLSAVSIELDVWSLSYPAFRGEIPFEGRPKTVGLDWDWKTPLDLKLKEFNEAGADIVLGDLPGGKRIDEAHDYMIANAKADGAIVVSRSLEGLAEWRAYFLGKGLKVMLTVLTVPDEAPTLTLAAPPRSIDPEHDSVLDFAEALWRAGQR